MACGRAITFTGRRTILPNSLYLTIHTNFMSNNQKENLEIINNLYPKEEMNDKIIKKYLMIKKGNGEFTWQQLLVIDRHLTKKYPSIQNNTYITIQTNFMSNDMEKNKEIIKALYPEDQMSDSIREQWEKVKNGKKNKIHWKELMEIDQNLTLLYLQNERADIKKLKDNFKDIDQIEFSKSAGGHTKGCFFKKMYGAEQGNYNSHIQARLDFINYFFNTDSDVFKDRTERYEKTGCIGVRLIDPDTMIEMSSLQDPTKLYDIPKSWVRYIRKRIDTGWKERDEYFTGDKVSFITHAKFCPIIWIKKSEKLKWIEREQAIIKRQKEFKYK